MISETRNLVDLLNWRASHQPEQEAYRFLPDGEDQPTSLTYAELDLKARLIAAQLQSQLAAGERVLLLYPPGLDYIAGFWGCLYSGMVAVPAYPPRRNRNLLRLKAVMADAQATTALTTSAILSRIQPFLFDISDSTTVRWLTHEELIESANNKWQRPVITDETLAFLQYTSGSTSTPKGVMLTHKNLLHNEEAIRKAFRQTEQSVIVGWLPLYHDMGLIGNVIQPLFTGARCILMSPNSFLQRPSRWLRAISDFKATTSGGPNFAYDLCARKIKAEECEGLDLSTWRVAFNGAERIHAETLQRFVDTFEPYGFSRDAFYPCYGLAEATLLATCRHDERPAVVRIFATSGLQAGRVTEISHTNESGRLLVACGGTVVGQQIAVVEPESLRECAPNEIGEIWINGPGVAAGYWNQPDETERTFHAYLSDTGAGPFLRTGDLGFLQDDELFVTGRLKDLLIIRGLNHYPEDIELTVASSHPALRSGGGAAFSIEPAGEERLVVVQEANHHEQERDEIIQRINEAITETHEVQAYAIALIRPGTIPKTSSGKIQRHACREAFLKGELRTLAEWRANLTVETQMTEASSALPQLDAGSIADWLRQQLASKLSINPAVIDVNHSIVRYGVDSLLAIELAHEIETQLGLVVPFSDFLQSPSISEITHKILELLHSDRVRREIDTITTTPRNEFPLSRGQQSLWFLYQLAPSSAAYNMAGAVRIKSPLDVSALRQVFQKLIDRHAALRTVFSSVDGQPVQRVLDQVKDYFEVIDASAWSEDVLTERLRVESNRPFDLENGPLLRVSLFKLSEQEHVLLLVLHHIISDFWSMAVLIHEMGILYAAEIDNEPVRLPSLELQYSDYVRWQEEKLESDRGEQDWVYWQKQLGGELPSLDLPSDRPRQPLQTYSGASETFQLDAGLTQRLKSLGQENDATLYMTLLAAFQVLLHRYTNQAELIVGAPTLGRPRKEFTELIGYFVNPLPLRLNLPAGPTFTSLLRQVREVVLEALEHQDFPFATMVERLHLERDASRSPIFQVAFVFQKAHLPEREMLSAFATGLAGAQMSLGGLDLESMALKQRIAQFDLTLMVAENDGELVASLEYNSDLFDAVTIERLAQHFQHLLGAVAANPEQHILSLPLLSEQERAELISQPCSWNAESHSLAELFEAQVERTPEHTALVHEGERFTYRELNAHANQLAHCLQGLGVGPESLVALYLDRSVEMVIAILAILKAGAAYLPLDLSWPAERVAFILKDGGASVLLIESELLEQLPVSTDGIEIICLDTEQARIATASEENPVSGTQPENLAYVIYTSGSTGQPKGALLTHANVTRLFSATQQLFNFDERDVWTLFHSYAFDFSVWEIFGPLLTGGRLVVVPYLVSRSPADFYELLLQEQVTVLNQTPSAFRQLMAVDEQQEQREQLALRLVIFGGEALELQSLAGWYERHGDREPQLVNMYGITETTVHVTVRELTKADVEKQAGSVIGRAIEDLQLYVLDSQLEPAPVGVAGELYVGGAGLARGYLKRAELTAEKFVPHPYSERGGERLYRTGDVGRWLSDGGIEYLGRKDEQVKIRGFRIELGEIETALSRHPAVREALVVATTLNEDKRLVAYLVTKENLETAELRQYLKGMLPEYMIPQAFVKFDQMPLTPNGKINRKALPLPESNRTEVDDDYVAPRTPAEEKLAKIWSTVLGVDRVGIHDNFYELGGDSIISLQVVARANQAGLALSAKDLLQHQTISEVIAVAGARSEDQLIEQNTVTGLVPLTPIQHWYFEKHGIDQHHFNQYLMLRPRKALDMNLLEEALQHLIAHHDALRLRFEKNRTTWRQINAEREPNQVLARINVSQLTSADREAAIRDAIADAHASLNLSEGPLISALFFDSGAARTDRLLLVIHHLAVDAVSWRILLEDLDRVYMQLSRSEPVDLGRKTHSFKQWAEQLQQYAESPNVQRDSNYWLDYRRREVSPVLLDKSDGVNDVNSAGVISVKIDREETRALRSQVPRAYRTRIHEALLTALLQAYEQWCGECRLLIDLEGHGREDELLDLDVSRTVGWFTSIFPLLLELDPMLSTGEVLQQVKEQVRRVPHNGVTYGMLRYLSGAGISAKLQSLAQPQISFNYLGELDDNLSTSEWFAVVNGRHGLNRSSKGTRQHVVEIDGWITGGQLRVNFTYSKNLHRGANIKALADNFITSLRELIAHCHSLEEETFTPSDFPLAKLDQRTFSKVAALLK